MALNILHLIILQAPPFDKWHFSEQSKLLTCTQGAQCVPYVPSGQSIHKMPPCVLGFQCNYFRQHFLPPSIYA